MTFKLKLQLRLPCNSNCNTIDPDKLNNLFEETTKKQKTKNQMKLLTINIIFIFICFCFFFFHIFYQSFRVGKCICGFYL